MVRPSTIHCAILHRPTAWLFWPVIRMWHRMCYINVTFNSLYDYYLTYPGWALSLLILLFDACTPDYYSLPRCMTCDCVCSCEDNVAGRRCDACTPGFYSFPRCMTCDCDPKGSLPEICDQQTSACLCKVHRSHHIPPTEIRWLTPSRAMCLSSLCFNTDFWLSKWMQ